MNERQTIASASPAETFALGAKIGAALKGGEIILLTGGLGAGKTLLTKGVLSALQFDVDEVTSPSFALVNLYRVERFNVYHVDLWRSEGEDAAFSVGLAEIIEDGRAIVIIEWAERLSYISFEDRTVYQVSISGDGDGPRQIEVTRAEHIPAANV